MQCVNCRFENMPGVENCGRCGATLRLTSLAIDVHPPRAGRWAKRWRKAPLARSRWSVACMAFAAGRAASWIPPWGLQVRLVLPGWAQFHVGHPLLGRRLLGAWAACLALGMLFFGGALGSAFLGLALACHAASAIDVAFATDPRPVGRWLVAGTLLAGLILVVYWPISSIAGRFVDTRVIRVDRPPLLAGDVLLFRPAGAYTRPQPGDVVIFTVQPTTIGLAPGLDLRLRGEAVDRVLAVGGQHVACDQGRLRVDGQPVSLGPLKSDNTFQRMRFELKVPQGMLLIFPSNFDHELARAQGSAISPEMCLVSHAAIQGKVFWRHGPPWRMGRVP